MSRLYKIVDWDKHFEIAQSKRPSKLSWVPIPNKHDGSGYKRITRLENSCEIFTAWVLIVQVASKCPQRGVLQKNGIPLNAEDLSICTDFPALIFERALKELSNSKIGWISYEDIPDQESAHTAIIPQSEHDMSTVDYRTVQDSTVQDSTNKHPLPPEGEAVSEDPKPQEIKKSYVFDPVNFDKFWDVYPKKVDKENALKKWKSMKCDSIAELIIDMVKTFRENNWLGKDLQYIPGPARFLNGKMWEDAVIKPGGLFNGNIGRCSGKTNVRPSTLGIAKSDGKPYPIDDFD